MEKNGHFGDLDNERVYHDCLRRAKDVSTLNFVADFGKEDAQVAFDVDAGGFEALLSSARAPGRPVRWM